MKNTAQKMGSKTYKRTLNTYRCSLYYYLLLFSFMNQKGVTGNLPEQELSSLLGHNTSVTSNAGTAFFTNTCIYTQWSEWFGDCSIANSCGSGIQVRNRVSVKNTDTCSDILQERNCPDKCVHVMATVGLLVIGMIDNPALGEGEDPTAMLKHGEVRHTYGSLTACSPGCLDIEGLDKDHKIICVMCTNANSCRRVGQLHMNKNGKFDIIRNRRQGHHALKVHGDSCSCSFTPDMPLQTGMCSAPSYYINLTVL